LTALSVGTGAPAMAAPGPNCGAYPPGHAYAIDTSSNFGSGRVVTVRRGAGILLFATISRNGENCSGRLVRFFVHGSREFRNGVPAYHLSATATTDSDGLAIVAKRATASFRWYAGYQSDNGTGVASSRGADRLVRVR
jgi:hypothetical protein